MRYLYLVLICGGLISCGGSSSNESAPPPTSSLPDTQPITQTVDYALFGDTVAQTGQSVGFAVANRNSSEITNVAWKQISGPQVTILADDSQTIGFDVELAGNYQFEFSLEFASGKQVNDSIELNVTTSTGSLLFWQLHYDRCIGTF